MMEKTVDACREIVLPTGRYFLVGNDKAITGLWKQGARHCPDLAQNTTEEPRLFSHVRRWLDAFFMGKDSEATIPLAPNGNAFEQSVWRLLLEIPYGQTVTYGELARSLSSGARAVGGAVGRNPISILIPCHRVVGAGNRITGYAGGIDTKLQLLSCENVDISRFR